MKRITYIILAILVPFLQMPLAAAEDATAEEAESVPSPVIITEVQTGSASGSDEFVELYNQSDEAVDVTGWQLRYSNAAAAGDGTTLIAELNDIDGEPLMLSPRSYYVLHTATVPVASGTLGATYSAKLSAADKVIALFAAERETCQLDVVDAIAWGTSVKGEGSPVQVTGTSDRLLQRIRLPDGTYPDTNNNAFDFIAQSVIKGTLVPQIAQGATPGTDNLQAATPTNVPEAGPGSALSPLTLEGCTLPPEEDPIDEPEIPPPSEEPPRNSRAY